MLAKIIFFTAVTAATLTVILLALVSPTTNKTTRSNGTSPQLTLALYLQHPQGPQRSTSSSSSPSSSNGHVVGTALVFRHILTVKNINNDSNGRIVGKAQGFIIPTERFAYSAFNVIYFTFDTQEYVGSLSVEAKEVRSGAAVEELKVVGGTGSFAFARGSALFVRVDEGLGFYHVKLRLRFPADILI